MDFACAPPTPLESVLVIFCKEKVCTQAIYKIVIIWAYNNASVTMLLGKENHAYNSKGTNVRNNLAR
jgi:hypothetical protein